MSLIPGAAVDTTSTSAAPDQSPGDAGQAVLLEVLDEGDVGGQRPGPDARRQLPLVVVEVLGAEGGGEPGLALDLDDEHGEARGRRPSGPSPR